MTTFPNYDTFYQVNYWSKRPDGSLALSEAATYLDRDLALEAIWEAMLNGVRFTTALCRMGEMVNVDLSDDAREHALDLQEEARNELMFERAAVTSAQR